MPPEHSLLIVDNFLAGPGVNTVSAELAGRLRLIGWTVVTTSTRRARLPRLLDMLATVIRRRGHYGVALVAVYSGAAFVWAESVCRALRLVGRPYVLVLHGGNLPDFAAHSPDRVRSLLGSAQAVVAPSRYLVETLRPYHGDIRLLPNPIDLSAYPFRPRIQPRSALLWLRAFHSIYNPALAVDVTAQLAEDFPDLHLTMIGPDKGDGALAQAQAAAAQLGVIDRLLFAGPIPRNEVPAHLEAGEIFLNTTSVDNTPISVLEALACGLCVVSTNAGGLPYLLTDDYDALLTPPGDAAALASAVRRILTEPGLAERLSRNARATAEAFDWSRVLPQWETLLAGQKAR